MADLEQNKLVKDKTLFIIEDDKPFRERLTTSFQRKDFTVTAAASKKEALDVLAGNNFNYAIVDLRLGDGSGLDVIKVIKEQNPECRTVMLTSYGNIATAVSSVKLGAVLLACSRGLGREAPSCSLSTCFLCFCFSFLCREDDTAAGTAAADTVTKHRSSATGGAAG